MAQAHAAPRSLSDQFKEFMHRQTSGALVLLVATVAALIIANSPLATAYDQFLHTELGVTFGPLEFEQSVLHWIDDALMAVFFFVVGLEIKREFIVGELSTLRGALLPVIAAVGGMLVPAAIYIAINMGTETQQGWGVPMATDIAFALGVLALLSSRVPAGLKVFLTALAIADDIGAILVIAVFYTSQVYWGWLLFALVPLAVLIVLNKRHVEAPAAYLLVASVLWFAFFKSGIHATIAGVIAAFTIPATARITPLDFTDTCKLKVDEIEQLDVPGAHTLADDEQQHLAFEIQEAAEHSISPLQRLEHDLHPVSTFVILPLFALANAGVPLSGSDLASPVSMGIILGLVVGKLVGVSGATFLAVKTGLTDLPDGVGWKHVVGAGALAGIGFTMSLFVANLAFRDVGVQAEAKVAIFVASIIAGVLGFCLLRFWAPRGLGRG